MTTQRPTIEELERILASGEPLKIQIQPDGSIKAVRPVVCAITECEGMAVMMDMLAANASMEDHESGDFGTWCQDSEILRMAARILKRYSDPYNEKGLESPESLLNELKDAAQHVADAYCAVRCGFQDHTPECARLKSVLLKTKAMPSQKGNQ